MSQQWLDAVRRLKGQPDPATERRIGEIAEALAAFLTSADGRAAMELLQISDKEAVFWGKFLGGGWGLDISLFECGYRRVYSQGWSRPETREVGSLDPQKAAEEIVNIENKEKPATAERVISSLRKSLDQIAQEVIRRG